MRKDDDKVPIRDEFFLWCIILPNTFCNIPYCLEKYLAKGGVKDRKTSRICGGMLVSRLERSYGILRGGVGNYLNMIQLPSFSSLRYKRARII